MGRGYDGICKRRWSFWARCSLTTSFSALSVFLSAVSASVTSPGFASFFGGTSLLIVVGVALDTLQQVESHLLMRHYDGFMKSGKLRGRR